MPNLAQCKNYIVLNHKTRNVNYGNGYRCDSGKYYRAGQTKITGSSSQWYRFMKPAGTKMPDYPPSLKGFKCGTVAPGWLEGGHPTNAGEVVKRRVCFSFLGKKCYGGLARNVKVTHCGEFYVYALPFVPHCTLGYCAI